MITVLNLIILYLPKSTFLIRIHSHSVSYYILYYTFVSYYILYYNTYNWQYFVMRLMSSYSCDFIGKNFIMCAPLILFDFLQNNIIELLTI